MRGLTQYASLIEPRKVVRVAATGVVALGIVVGLVYQLTSDGEQPPRAEALLPALIETKAQDSASGGSSPAPHPVWMSSYAVSNPADSGPEIPLLVLMEDSTPSGTSDTSEPVETLATEAVGPPALKPTFSWVNAYSLHSTLDGQPLPVGTVITAYDPQGTLVGQAVVKQEGRYGLMALYQDDPTTTEDEGADPGDPLTFKVDGFSAQVAGPDEPTWTSNADLRQLDLIAVSTSAQEADAGWRDALSQIDDWVAGVARDLAELP